MRSLRGPNWSEPEEVGEPGVGEPGEGRGRLECPQKRDQRIDKSPLGMQAWQVHVG